MSKSLEILSEIIIAFSLSYVLMLEFLEVLFSIKVVVDIILDNYYNNISVQKVVTMIIKQHSKSSKSNLI